jgi:hypothetical protein
MEKIEKIEQIQEIECRKETLTTEIFESHLTTNDSREIEMTVKTEAEKAVEIEVGTEVDRTEEKVEIPKCSLVMIISQAAEKAAEIAAEKAAQKAAEEATGIIVEEAAEVTVEGAAEAEAGTAVERAAEIDIFPARTDATLTVTVEAWSLEKMNYIPTAIQRGIYRVDITLFASDAYMRTIQPLSAIAFSLMDNKEARRLANANVT